MNHVVLDDHLLRDVLAGELSEGLTEIVDSHQVATTNLYYVRLCRSVVGARGGVLTRAWSAQQRRALGRRLLQLPASVLVVPMREIGYRVAALASLHRMSVLGAEAVAAAELLAGSLCVWDGDDGPGIRDAAKEIGIAYRAISR